MEAYSGEKLRECFSARDSVRNKIVPILRRLQSQVGMDVRQRIACTEPVGEFGQFADGGSQ